jgi:hypothetical protein
MFRGELPRGGQTADDLLLLGRGEVVVGDVIAGEATFHGDFNPRRSDGTDIPCVIGVGGVDVGGPRPAAGVRFGPPLNRTVSAAARCLPVARGREMFDSRS